MNFAKQKSIKSTKISQSQNSGTLLLWSVGMGTFLKALHAYITCVFAQSNFCFSIIHILHNFLAFLLTFLFEIFICFRPANKLMMAGGANHYHCPWPAHLNPALWNCSLYMADVWCYQYQADYRFIAVRIELPEYIMWKMYV